MFVHSYCDDKLNKSDFFKKNKLFIRSFLSLLLIIGTPLKVIAITCSADNK